MQEELFIKFAEFEERCKEFERARAIFRYALDHIPKAQADAVYQRFVQFEKQHGDREGIEVWPPVPAGSPCAVWREGSMIPVAVLWPYWA